MIHFPIESLNLQMLNVGLARHNGDWNWQKVNSPFTRIYLVTEGEAWLHLPLRTIELRPRHLYIVPAYTVHSYECHSIFIHYYLHVYEGFKNETNVFDMFDFPAEVGADDLDYQLFDEMCHAHPEASLPESNPQAYDNTTSFTDYAKRYNALTLGQKMRLRGAMLVLFSKFMQVATPKVWATDERMKEVLTYIQDHLYDNIDVDVLASIACVNKCYFIRLFKREVGVSPLRYINQKKTEKAQLLLLTADMPVKEVAYELGFFDLSYFIRLFKKKVGMTPQEYRASMR
jgi:AraC-like DNA-binding protein